MSTQDTGSVVSRHGLSHQGIRHYATAYWNLSPAQLIQLAVKRGEGELTQGGAFLALTGDQTGRSPNDKFIVEEPATRDSIWWGKVNVATTDEAYRRLHAKVTAYLQARDLFVQDLFAGAGPVHQQHNPGARHLFSLCLHRHAERQGFTAYGCLAIETAGGRDGPLFIC